MANIEGIITANVRDTLAPGLIVYDIEKQKIGIVNSVDFDTGWFVVKTEGLSSKTLWFPISLIQSIDPRDLFLADYKTPIMATYSSPPARKTVVRVEDGVEIAITTEANGYDATPVLVQRTRIGPLKRKIVAGSRVSTSDYADLGIIKQYDPATGWMLVEKGARSDTRDLMLPVALVQSIDPQTSQVYLVASQADLKRMAHLEPAEVAFAEAQVAESK